MKNEALIIWYIICFAAGRAVFSSLRITLLKAGHTRSNFMGKSIPTSLGSGYFLLSVLMGLAVAAGTRGRVPSLLPATLIIVTGFGLLGMLDDVVTNREPGGLKGHLARFGGGGGISTALIKAGFGLLLSFMASIMYWINEGWGMAFVNGLIIALSANTINLLDVRPGRAVKGFMTLFTILVGGSLFGAHFGWASISHATLVMLAPFFIWAIAGAALDFRAEAMMGDAGSNILGSVIGILVVVELSYSNRLIFLAFLVGFHLLCEITSLSSIIESVPFLKKLDRLFIAQSVKPTDK